jgi:hypothetical protein
VTETGAGVSASTNRGVPPAPGENLTAQSSNFRCDGFHYRISLFSRTANEEDTEEKPERNHYKPTIINHERR